MIRTEIGRDMSETHVFLVPVFPTYAMCKAGAKGSRISTGP